MKKLIFLGLILCFSSFVHSQQKEISKEILEESCNCIKKIKYNIDKEVKNDSIKSCITTSIINNQTKKLIDEMSKMKDTLLAYKKDTVIGNNKTYKIFVDEGYEEIQKKLLEDCPSLKSLLMVNNKESKNSYSDKEKAMQFYKTGERYYNEEKYDLALVEYNKAIKKDSKFAFAWGNMGICYRKLKRYQEAINCYKKSLEIDPKGSMPLMNMAVAYEYLKEYKNGALTYLKYIEYYPEDPEGYYGAGRAYFYDEEYEKGLDNIFQAFLIYKKTNSPYVHDAESNISAFYNDLKEKQKLDIFNKVAKKYNIEIK